MDPKHPARGLPLDLPQFPFPHQIGPFLQQPVAVGGHYYTDTGPHKGSQGFCHLGLGRKRQVSFRLFNDERVSRLEMATHQQDNWHQLGHHGGGAAQPDVLFDALRTVDKLWITSGHQGNQEKPGTRLEQVPRGEPLFSHDKGV